MAQEEFEPAEFLARMAMLVLEARTPHPSAKGRVEGPHCSMTHEEQRQHLCCPERPQCAQAREVRQSIDVMWRNGVPVNMDILLFPDCEHGLQEVRSLEGTGSNFVENTYLLERWSIKCVSARQRESKEGVGGSQLLQALRSYLHFSQLSSWLTSMHGCLPVQIAHRLYTPGDTGDEDEQFRKTPETHIFPTAVSGPHRVKVTVLHVPRLAGFPVLRCALETRSFWLRNSGLWRFDTEHHGDRTSDREKLETRGIRRKGHAAQYAKTSGPQQEPSTSASSNRQQSSRHSPPLPSSHHRHHDDIWAARDSSTPQADQSPRKILPKHHPYKARPTKDYTITQDPFAEKKRHKWEFGKHHPDERRHAHDQRKSAKAASSHKRTPPTQDNKRPLQDGVRYTPHSKRPSHGLSSPYRRTEHVPRSRSNNDIALPASEDNDEDDDDDDDDDPPDKSMLRMKDGCQSVMQAQKPSLRENLESQLRPLELTPPRAASSLDLHSPKVLMSEVFYSHPPPPPPPLATRCMQLDFSQPLNTAPWAQVTGDPEFLLRHHFGQGPPGLLSQLELSMLFYNLHSLTTPMPPLPHTTTTPPLPYEALSSEKADRLAKSAALWNWSQVQTPVQWRQDKGGEEGEGDVAKPCVPRLQKKALLFGKDPPTHTNSSPGAPASEVEQLCAAKQASFSAQEPQRPSASSLKRTSPELPTRKTKVKKREGVSAEGGREDGSGLTESIRVAKTEEGREAQTVSAHSTPSSAPESVGQTGRGAPAKAAVQTTNNSPTPTVQPGSGHYKTRLAVDALSDSWSSSSSSSSSSTFSSSPKVLRESGGRHSDSSTPTNLSTSPLPEDQQCPPCPARPAPPHAAASFSADIPSASSSSSDSSRPPLGHLGVEPCPFLVQDCRSLALEDASKTACLSEMAVGVSRSQGSAEAQRLQKEAAASNSSDNGHLPSPQPFLPENCQGVENDHVMSESDKPSSSLLSASSSSASFSSCNEILVDIAHADRDHVQASPPPSKTTKQKPSGLCQSSAEEDEKSLCTFYLESSDPPVKSYQWESVLDQDMDEDKELTSLLENLRLLPAESPRLSPSGPGREEEDEDRTPQPRSNGVAVNGVARVQSQGHSKNGHVGGDVVRNGESPHSVTDQSSSLTYQLTCNGCSGSRSPCDFPFRREEDDDGISGGVSIPNASVVPAHLGKAADQRGERATICGETLSLCGSVLTPCLFASRGARNQAASTSPVDTAAAIEVEDSVFHDKASDVSGVGNVVAHCPSRTKSAPSFYCLTEKGEKTAERDVSPEEMKRGRPALREKEGLKAAGSDRLRHRLVKSASILFNSRGSVPSQSSPAPIKRRSTGRFDYDETLTSTKAIKSAISLSRLPDVCKDSSDSLGKSDRVLSTSAPASTNCLLGNFEESILNGRLEPAGVVEGFSIDIGASGKFCPRHVSLPVTAYFFNLSDDNAPSPYLGHINLDTLGKRGYHIPNVGTLQVTLFNPNKTVVKMFVVKYDLQDMPPNCQTVLRQRTLYQPLHPHSDLPAYLRYLIHLRLSSSSSGKTYLHTDIRLIFARNKFELDSSEVQYKLCSYTETPLNPKYSPKR